MMCLLKNFVRWLESSENYRELDLLSVPEHLDCVCSVPIPGILVKLYWPAAAEYM